MKVLEFSDAQAVSQYYDRLYAVGYMDAVSPDKIERIASLLRDAGLSAGHRVLDFGCGIGNLTASLAAQFPGVFFSGCDISPFAVERAQATASGIEFFALSDSSVSEHAGGFDFIVSHHVLEHVCDPRAAAGQIAAMAAPRAVMVHALPSGDKGSMEHEIARLYYNGIESIQGNRFFFEDPSHLRRFTSHQVADLFSSHRFTLSDALFANQFWGSVNWITDGDPRVPFALFRPLAWDAVDLSRIVWMLIWTTLLTLARTPWRFCRELVATGRRIARGQGRTSTRRKALVLGMMLPIMLPLLAPSWLVDAVVRKLAKREWDAGKRTPYGSEMYLVLTRFDVTQ